MTERDRPSEYEEQIHRSIDRAMDAADPMSTKVDAARDRLRARLDTTIDHYDGKVVVLVTDLDALIAGYDELKAWGIGINERVDEPTTCKVWRHGVLVFDGLSRDAFLAAGSDTGGGSDPAHTPGTLEYAQRIAAENGDLDDAAIEDGGGS